jgi:beta-N-acetylhexosaminidase
MIALWLCAGVWQSVTSKTAHAAHYGKTVRVSAKRAYPSLEEMVGQMIMIGFRGTGEEPVSDDLRDMLADIRMGRIGGVILFDHDITDKNARRNIRSLEQSKALIARLQAAAPLPLFVAVDQEGGRVRRFKEAHGMPYTPSPQELGRRTPEETFKDALHMGKILHSLGVNLNFAPSLDVNSNPLSPVIGALGRSFSDNPLKVAAHALAFARGLSKAGVLSCYKHFPGHGSATDDTHIGLANVSATWRKQELEPYRIALASQPPAMIMVGHVVLRQKSGSLPASLSRNVINGMLRRNLGWKGVVITDDLQMGAIAERYHTKETIRLAISAGVDILLFGNNIKYNSKEGAVIHSIVMDMVRAGHIPPKRIEESYKRIMKLKTGLDT